MSIGLDQTFFPGWCIGAVLASWTWHLVLILSKCPTKQKETICLMLYINWNKICTQTNACGKIAPEAILKKERKRNGHGCGTAHCCILCKKCLVLLIKLRRERRICASLHNFAARACRETTWLLMLNDSIGSVSGIGSISRRALLSNWTQFVKKYASRSCFISLKSSFVKDCYIIHFIYMFELHCRLWNIHELVLVTL